MATDRSPLPSAEVLWRPGCPFCTSLRRGLRRAGVATVEHDIWASPTAAARVRAVTGGDETVPTVIVGMRSLVNPSVRQVVQALAAEYPAREQPVTAAEAAGPSGRPGGASGLLWTAVITLVWTVLAVWRPSTTWHLAPLLIAAAWPWVVGQDQSPGDPSSRRRVVAAGGAGLATLATAALSATGHLQGPTWAGSGSPMVEALLLAAAGSALATAAGLARTIRRSTSALARVGTQTLATADDVVIVEATPTSRWTACRRACCSRAPPRACGPWKGVASYYDVHVDDRVISDGAWTYRHPRPPGQAGQGARRLLERDRRRPDLTAHHLTRERVRQQDPAANLRWAADAPGY